LFADDTSILVSHSNQTEFDKKLNVAFKNLDDWFGKNLLSLNISKTHCINFTTKTTKSIVLNISRENKLISMTNQTKFLGLLTDYTLYFMKLQTN
jgi:hypothetical protein